MITTRDPTDKVKIRFMRSMCSFKKGQEIIMPRRYAQRFLRRKVAVIIPIVRKRK